MVAADALPARLRTPGCATNAGHYRAAGSDACRTDRRTCLREHPFRTPDSAWWPHRRWVRVRCSSGHLLKNEKIPDKVVDVGRPEPGDQVVARPGGVDRVSAQGHIAKARQWCTRRNPVQKRIEISEHPPIICDQVLIHH